MDSMQKTYEALDYPYVKAWGIWLTMEIKDVNKNLLEAKENDAPRSAVFKANGKWVPIEKVKDLHIKENIERLAADVERISANRKEHAILRELGF